MAGNATDLGGFIADCFYTGRPGKYSRKILKHKRVTH